MNKRKNLQMKSIATQFCSNDIFFQEEDQASLFDGFNIDAAPAKQPPRQQTSITPEDESSQQKKNKNGKKCLNHNFQKHTVITVKKLMRLRYSLQGSPEEKLAFKMWNIFMVSDIKSKKILVILFGAINKRDQRDILLFKKCGFEEILSEDEEIIQQAQQVLRKRFVETVTQDVVQENIRNFRSIKQCQEFFVYFTELLRIIKRGPLLKFRINDKTSRKIRQEIKTKLSL